MDVMHDEQRQASGREAEWAAQVQRDNPLWLVMFGDFSREYTAFPLFPRAPSGLVISNRNPAELAARLRQVQEQYGYRAHNGGISHMADTNCAEGYLK